MLKLCWSRHSLRRASPFTYHINIGNWGPVINLSEVLRAKKKKKVCLKPYMISKDDFSTILSMFIELFKKTGPFAQMFASCTLPRLLLTHLLSFSAKTEENFSWATHNTGLMLHLVEGLDPSYLWTILLVFREVSVFRHLWQPSSQFN